MRQIQPPANRPLLLLLLMLLCAMTAIPGCQVLGLFGDVITPEQNMPLYELQEVKTVVLVDDVRNLLGDPRYTGQIAERISFDIVENKVLEEEMIVGTKQVRELEALLGEEFITTPLDQVGRAVGADQLIHINVEHVNLSADPGVLRPEARVAVKVIDAKAGKRVFPAPTSATNLPGAEGSSRGHLVTLKMNHYIQRDMDRGSDVILLQKLADRIGVEVARLFYKHKRDKPDSIRGN